MKRTVLAILVLWSSVFAENLLLAQSAVRLTIPIDEKEFWWIGVINHGSLFPIQDGYQADMTNNCYGNQAQPLLLSSKGRLVWSNEPFKITSRDNSIELEKKTGVFELRSAGDNLRDAYLFASKQYFPPSGKMPDEFLFSSPQYNTWIELLYNQNEKDILKYAKGILDNGFPPGTLMIDDNWQEDYGTWRFHPGRFPNPKAMIDTLHAWGFKVMLWVCPFVSPDSETFRKLMAKGVFLNDAEGYPKMVKWWNGSSAVLDLTDEEAGKWFEGELNYLMKTYTVDGFKFDAGDPEFYLDGVSDKPITPNEQSEQFAKLGLKYPLNEYRATWKMGGQGLAQRLRDKGHTWNDLQLLIPDILLQGIMGYPYTCPDMIGGGEMGSFLNLDKVNQDLIVRSAQCHALMPMMQFSVAPWRVLDPVHLNAVKKAINLRSDFSKRIEELAAVAAKTGEPIVRMMEYNYPNQGYEMVQDQFLLGNDILVAPMVTAGVKRKVTLPKGKWRNMLDGGKVVNGPKLLEVEVQLDELAYFIRYQK